MSTESACRLKNFFSTYLKITFCSFAETWLKKEDDVNSWNLEPDSCLDMTAIGDEKKLAELFYIHQLNWSQNRVLI